MRFDLIVNTMYKCAMLDGKITVNNPSIWRPILDIRDAASAYMRSVQADYSISGVFNVGSGNYTVGQVGDIVKEEVEDKTGKEIQLEIKDIKDFRNYKVTFNKAKTELGFQPRGGVREIVSELVKHQDEYGQFDRDEFYNIAVFKKML